MITVAVISDTHMPRGSRRLPAECVERLRNADLILHAGDFVAPTVLRDLRALGPEVAAVYGNMDDAELRAQLDRETRLDFAGTVIGMVHDGGPRAGREARLAARFPGAAAVVYGHTHVPHMTQHEGVWILNPGSPTERRTAPAHSMIELRIVDRRIEPELVALPA